MASQTRLKKEEVISLNEHQNQWSEIFDKIQKAVDIVAFQDGHIDYYELDDFFKINKTMVQKYHLRGWTNAESFARDMPIRFLPVKFEKRRLKLEIAGKANYEKAISFEFSHFMSPQSSYIQAHHLFNLYCEYLEELKTGFKK